MKLICKKCGKIAKEIILDTYEYIEGFPLRNVKAFECPKCREFIFTPEQVEEIEKRTDQLKAHIFAFERKITISGRSLVINIPEDLAHHLNMVKGKKVKLIPLDNRRFLVEAIGK